MLKTGTVIAVTADNNILFHEPLKLAREKLLVGFNDEILDIRYLNDSHIAVATNSPHVLFCVIHAVLTVQVRIFDVATGGCELLSEHSDIVLAIDMSHDGKWLATASKDSTLCVWDLANRRYARSCLERVNQ